MEKEKDFYEIIDDLKDTLKESIDNQNGILADLTFIEEQYKTLADEQIYYKNKITNLLYENDKLVDKLEQNPMETLEEIISKAEQWDYGIKGWRTLETKQDLIDAIKKEVLL